MTPAPILTANGASIPRIGLGTWRGTGDEAARGVAHALQVGYRHLDTAAMYDNERDVGEGIRRSGIPREDIFVTTKVWTDDIRQGELQRSAEASLKRLGLDRVDLLLIHWPNAQVPLGQSLAALCDVNGRGLARHIGVSNFTVALLDEAVRSATEPLVANQCEYHPFLDQSAVLAACERHGMAFTAYCPLGRGSSLENPVLRRIAGVHDRSVAQICLRWHMQQPNIIAIPKSTNPKRMEENLDIFDFTLSDAEMAEISSLKRTDGRDRLSSLRTGLGPGCLTDVFFVASKLLWFVFAPSNIILAVIGLTFLAALTRRRRAIVSFATISFGLALLCGIGPVGNLLILPLEERFPVLRDVAAAPDGIIVLGGAVEETLSEETGQLQLNEAAERITAMIALARRFPQARLVFSGGSGALLPRAGVTEADVVSSQAEALGLSAGRLTIESRSVNTRENAVETARLVQPRPGERWLLVTSGFHMPRSIGCFRKAGFDVVAFPVDLRTGRGHALALSFAMADGLRRTDVAAREWLGLLVYWLVGYTNELFPAPA